MSVDHDLRQLWNRVRLMVAPVKVKLVTDDKGTQTQQIDLGPQAPEGSLGVHDAVPVLLAFGFVSNPPAGSDALALHVGGDRSNAVIIAHGHQAYRLKNLAAGDAALHDIRGAYVWLTADGPVIDAAGGAVKIQNATSVTIDASDSPGLIVNCDVQITGNLSVNGSITATDDITAGTISLEDHVHGGVTAGAAETDAPTG